MTHPVRFGFRALLFIACVAAQVPLHSQTFYGSITGTVMDPSGSVIPGASVTLTNSGTSERRSTQTETQGTYRFLSLLPGNYRLDVEAPGFKHFTRDAVKVDVQAAMRIDANMEVGNVGESVEVTAQTPLLQTESTALSQVVETRHVLEMPLNGRNVYDLVQLVPGVAVGGTSPTSATYQVNGGFAGSNAEFMDGVPLNSAYINQTFAGLSQDAVQEFRLTTNNLTAEFGRTAGGVMNLTSRSGSNQIHGSAYDFLRNKVLNANNFFANKAGAGLPAFTQNQFGGTIGGAAIKDKLFYYFSYEGFAQRQGQTFILNVPMPQWKTGDFSNLRNSAGNLVPIYDPLTSCGANGNPACAVDSQGNPVYSRTPFPNNTIPSTRLDPTAQALNKMIWANPNQPGNQYTSVNNYIYNASGGTNTNQYNTRVDYNITANNRFFARYFESTNNPIRLYPFGNKLTTNGSRPAPWYQAILGETYTFGSNKVLDIRGAYMRHLVSRYSDQLGMDLTTVGWPSFMNSQVQYRVMPQPCVQNFDGVSLCNGNTQVINLGSTNTYFFGGSLSWVTGRHSLKFGGEYRTLQFNMSQTNAPSGGFSFDNVMTSANPYAPNNTGYSFASYMLGYGSSGSLSMNPQTAGTTRYQSAYVTDVFQLNSRLTLTYGVRWEVPTGWTERYDRQVVLDPNKPSPIAQAANMPNLMGTLTLVKSSTWPTRYSMQRSWTNVMPRVGLAYRFDNKTVVRAGYGMTTLPTDLIYDASPYGNPVTFVSNTWVPTLDSGLTPYNVLSNPYPNGLNQPPGRNPSYNNVLLGNSVLAPVGKQPYSYTMQFNVDLQRELRDGLLIDAAFAGSRGVHLPAYSQTFDQLPAADMSLGTKLLQQVPNPFYGVITNGSALAAKTVSYGQLLRPYPQYTVLGALDITDRDNVYDSLQLKLEKRFKQGGTILGAYTWSKNIGDSEGGSPWSQSDYNTGAFFVQNSYNLRLERSLSNLDISHRLVASYVFDIPVGRGQKLLANIPGVVDKVIGGWGFNGITSFQSGFPLGFQMASDTSNSYGTASNGGGGTRPNIVSGCSMGTSGSAQSRLNAWFNTSCFSAPAPFTFGNAARLLGQVRTAGINNWDLAMFKKFTITERVGLQYRVESFNSFNRVQFGYPGMTMGNASFGVVSGIRNAPRIFQMALRLSF